MEKWIKDWEKEIREAEKVQSLNQEAKDILKLIAHIERLETELARKEQCWNETMSNVCQNAEKRESTYKAVVEKAKFVTAYLKKRPISIVDLPYLYSNIEELDQALQAVKEQK